MKALQDRCKAKEGVIRRYRKRQEHEVEEQDQYKESARILNVELMAKVTSLETKDPLMCRVG